MRTVSFTLLLAALLAVSACSDDSSNDALATTTTLAATTTTAPAATTTASETTTTTAASGCNAGPRPADAVAVTEAPGDFDGDGAQDTLVGYGEGTAEDPLPLHLRIELASGGAVDALIPDAAADLGGGRALGGAEISASAGLPPDGSGVEAFATVGSGASVSLVGVWQLKECVLTRLNGPSGDPSQFAIGGGVTHGDGLRCDGISGGQRLVTLRATSADGVTYSTTETLLRVEGDGLVQGNPPVVGSLTLPDDDDALQAYYGLACIGVVSP